MHLFVDKLTNVDFSYLHPERGLVGETWLASIVLEGALDEQGMVCDFGIVKKTLRKWLDETIDHCLVVPKQSPALECNEVENQIELDWSYKRQETTDNLQCLSPAEAITLIDSDVISPESVAQWCIKQLRTLLPDTIDKIQLTFEPEVITSHYYHYSHGLKKHQGNCQRIAHGHRSTIEIYRDNHRDSHLEQQWCEQWADIYIGSKEDLTKVSRIKNVEYYTFTYTAQQGDFQLTLPANHCYLIDTDSTVEFIAEHIVQALKITQPESNYKVRAFEGIGKGAIAFTE
ncbi:MAG: 6-carboxytetrahydropterin synthase [Cellvibrionaceae bacterium]